MEAWDKGTAVRLILAELAPDVIPVYFGDSENDLPGMEASLAARGMTVAIGDAAPNCATYRLGSAAELHADVARLCEALVQHTVRVLADSGELSIAE